MLLAAHSISDPNLDITVGPAHDDAENDDNVTVVGEYDLVLRGNAGVASTIKSLLRGRKRLIWLLLFLATMAKKQQHRTRNRKTSSPNRRVLGSAMIGSITEALSPILPFAGGVDLRRGEHWGLDDDYNISSSHWSGWFWLASTDIAGESTRSNRKTSFFGTRSRLLNDDGSGTSTDSRSTKKQKRPRTIPTASRDPVIAAPDPFVTTEEIAKLTLEDIAVLFQYAVHATRGEFDMKSFMEDSASGRVADVITSLEQSVATSRGDGIVPAATKSWVGETSDEPNNFGDVDALMFCGAMRILAEWRVLRQVPDGYKGYAVGMSLGHKDVVQNLVKIESAIHDLIELRKQDYQDALDDMEGAWDEASCQSDGDANEPTCVAVRSERPRVTSPPPALRSPTLRELLQYEINEGIQNLEKLPRLKEKSAGMGLLWVRRQLAYQTEVFANVLLVPSQYESITDAVAAAYSTIYDQFHGWAVQKIFNYSFQAAPDADLIFRHMNPSKLQEVTTAALNGDIGDADDDIQALLVTSSSHIRDENEAIEEENLLLYDEELNQTPFYQLPLLNQTYVEDWAASAAAAKSTEADYQEDDEDGNPWIRFGLHVASEWDKFGKHVVSEWDKLSSHVESEWDKLSSHVESEMDKFGKHVEQEWEKMTSNIIQIFQGGDNPSKRATNSFARDGTFSGEALELYIGRKMEEDAKSHISIYLDVVSPLLKDIAGLFEEMNCDDLTKV